MCVVCVVRHWYKSAEMCNDVVQQLELVYVFVVCVCGWVAGVDGVVKHVFT